MSSQPASSKAREQLGLNRSAPQNERMARGSSNPAGRRAQRGRQPATDSTKGMALSGTCIFRGFVGGRQVPKASQSIHALKKGRSGDPSYRASCAAQADKGHSQSRRDGDTLKRQE